MNKEFNTKSVFTLIEGVKNGDYILKIMILLLTLVFVDIFSGA